MDKIIGIGEAMTSANPQDVLKTFALSSCVAITAYSPIRRVAGMIHMALPTPPNLEEGLSRPYYYVKTGIPLFFNQLYRQHGCSKNELNVTIFGGAESIYDNDSFRIGQRNLMATLAMLSMLGLKIIGSQTGGQISRTLELDVATGLVTVTSQPLNI